MSSYCCVALFIFEMIQPLWVLKTAKEKCLQRLVHLSSDLARQVAIVLENAQVAGEVLLVPSFNNFTYVFLFLSSCITHPAMDY